MPRSRSLPLCLLPLAAPALAAPAPPGPVDLDGDGRPEQIELGAELVVRRGAEVLGRLPLAGLREPRLEAAPRPYVVVRGARPGGAALLVAALRGGRLEEVYSGPVGPVGRDGEYSVQVEVAADVLRYQSAPGVTRCDGDGRLFPARYRPGAGWQPSPSPLPAGRRLTARGTPPAGLGRQPLPVYRVAAVSAQAGVDRADLLAPPRELEDGRPETAWRLPGDGKGAWVTLRASGPGHSVRALRVTPPSGLGAPKAPRTLAAIFADGKSFSFDLPPGGPSFIELPQPEKGPCVSLAIVAGAEGSGLGEVAAYSELDGQGPAALARLAASADMQVGEGAARALGQLPPGDAGAALAAIGEALASAQGGGRRRLGTVLGELVRGLDGAGRERLGGQAAPILTRALGGAPAEERSSLFAVLAMLPQAAVALGTLAADTSQPAPLRGEALAQLGARADEAAVAALLRLGEAAREAPVRRGVVAGLGTALRCARAEDPRMILARTALMEAAKRRPSAVERVADLGEALGRAGAACDGGASAPAAALAEAWQALGAEDAFAGRYRLLQALGALGPGAEAAAPLLREVLLKGPEPALRTVAARAAAGIPGAAHGELARRGLADIDPGVRLAALAALAGRRDAATVAAMEQALASDLWPQVRRAAADATAAVCPPGAGDTRSLRRALKDTDDEVQRRALAGIARCEGARAAPLLAEIARGADRDPALRGQACSLLARHQGAAAAPTLGAVLSQVVQDAGSDDRQTGLAISCLRALGRVAGPAALAPILDALGDNAAVDTVAYEQIGALCRGGIPPALRPRLGAQLAASKKAEDPRLRAAATAAARRCGMEK